MSAVRELRAVGDERTKRGSEHRGREHYVSDGSKNDTLWASGRYTFRVRTHPPSLCYAVIPTGPYAHSAATTVLHGRVGCR